MNTPSGLDRESLQTLLANSYAVQSSSLGKESLRTLVEMQRSFACGKFDLDRSMFMVTDYALKVSNASGVAVALIEGGELVYRAGSGTARNDVGRRIPAVLTISFPGGLRKEILRVDNAQTDSRVEAEVCRQFEANSLLMLPIYSNRVLTGFLQVFFSQAHSFTDPEVRVYRMILSIFEEAMSRDSQRAPEAVSHVELVGHPVSSQPRQATEHAITPLVYAGLTEQAESRTYSSMRDQGLDSAIRELWAFWIEITAVIPKNMNSFWRLAFWRFGSMVTAALVIAIAIWVAHQNSSPSTVHGLPSLPYDVGRYAPVNSSLRDAAKHITHKTKEGNNTHFKRILIGPNEVDYVADDVTIRQFTAGPSKPHLSMAEKEVHFGEDVTVRYFGYAPTALQTRSTFSVPKTTKYSNSTSP